MMDTRLKIKDIIYKLKKLDCPFLDNRDEASIIELLFKQNLTRYQLLEWICLKFDFIIPNVSECENSLEGKEQNILATLADLGLCNRDRSDIIQGVAACEAQLVLWDLLVQLLWKKFFNINRGQISVDCDSMNYTDQYENHSNYINRICESVNFNNLFKKKVQLFPPFLIKESMEASVSQGSDIKSLEEIKASADEKFGNSCQSLKLDTGRLLSTFCKDSNEDASNEGPYELECRIQSSLSDVQGIGTTDFKDAYYNLKPYLSNIALETFDNIGPSFKDAELNLESAFQLSKSLSSLKVSESEVKNLNSELHTVQMPSGTLSDFLLKEYTETMSDEKKLNG